MRYALLFWGLLLTVIKADAQQVPGSFATPVALSQADSVAVIHSVFQRHRWSARTSTALDGGLLAGSAVMAVVATRGGYVKALSPLLIFNGSLGLFNISKRCQDLVRYSRKREAHTITEFEQHQPLPRYLRNQLLLAFWYKERDRAGKWR